MRVIASWWGSRNRPPCPAADEVQELCERELGLPPPRASGRIGEEGVLKAQPDAALTALALDYAQRHRSACPSKSGGSSARDRRPGRAAARPGPHSERSGASGSPRSRGRPPTPRRGVKQAGSMRRSNQRAPPGEVRAGEREPEHAHADDAQRVRAGEAIEAAEQGL